MQNVTEVEIGYTAGLLDGEGCITVYPKTIYDPRKRQFGYAKYRHLQLTVSIANTNQAVVLWLQEHYGGNVHCRHHANAVWKSLWGWSINGRPAAAFLHPLEPHLIIKKEEAQTALLFAETMEWPMLSTGRRGGRKLSEETVRIRHLCYSHLRALKTRGWRTPLVQTREGDHAFSLAS